MNTNELSPRNACVDENRRALLTATFGVAITSFFAGATTLVLAQEIKPKFEYIPSKLGIDYYALAPSPLAEILSQGELEWMENATPVFGEKSARYWKGVSKSVATGNLSKVMIDWIQQFSPNMLTKFAVGLHPQDPKYGGLWSVGTNHVASGLANNS